KTGFMENGKDLGSSYVSMITDTKIAILSGEPTSTLEFGEVWHFFEQQLHYPVTILDSSYLNGVDLSDYDVLILPDGRYGSFFGDKKLENIKCFGRNGGKLIAMQDAIKCLIGKDKLGIKEKEIETDSLNVWRPYGETERESIKNSISGAIFKAKVDTTHPLGYGYENHYFTLKLGEETYANLESGTVAYLERNAAPVSVFAGSEAVKKMGNTLVFGVEDYGRGQVVYLVDNPLFRGFWENGKLFFVNALFMVQ